MLADALPSPLTWHQLGAVQFDFGAILIIAAGVLYGLGVWRVGRSESEASWPVRRTIAFFGGLVVTFVAIQSVIGVYDDVLFYDHMIQHLLLIMVAPPLLVTGQPATLLLHASRNPLHTWAKKTLRSPAVAAITWPPFVAALYLATIVGTHLTSFMNLVLENGAVHDGEHALYLAAGYLYFLPLIGREPIRWRVSYPSRIFLLFIAMPVDAFTGLVLGSEGTNPFPALALRRPGWAPSPISDVHIGGAVMWVGGAGIMFGVVMAVFFAWSRETRADGGLGWLEAARRSNLATLVSSHQNAGAGPGPAVPARRAEAATPAGSRAPTRRPVPTGSQDRVDDDDEALAAYNAFLARINKPPE
jgi:cytochrome c oxidase assembly factor CtaG